jgi:hypothetical protein
MALVQRAVIKALVEAGRVMSVGEAHSAVDALLGRRVSLDSVSSSLSTGARGTWRRFERVARGCIGSHGLAEGRRDARGFCFSSKAAARPNLPGV